MADLTGRLIRGYEIMEKIGEGGFGAVYKAHQPAVGRDVAIKVILPEHAIHPEFGRRFESEARLVARLEHPHIVPLYDYWQDEQGAFLVMRWLYGSLRGALRRQGAWSLAQSVRLLDQITDALAVAHQAGVIHRDLKPDNILLDERGNAYLADFGIAKHLDSDTHITESNAVLGSPGYFAPEQIKSEPVVPQTDIYSLGIVLYEMLTGEHPFAEARLMVIMKHLQDPLPPVQRKRADLPPAVDQVIQKATAKHPDDRYTGAPALAHDFRLAANLTPGVSAVIQPPAARTLTPPPLPRRTTATTPEQRNRSNMLHNVRAYWIAGVLENSLHGATMIELGLKQREGVVDHPWDMLVRTLNAPDRTLTPGTSVLDMFDRMNGKMLILGEPGSGKTTMLLELARDLLQRAEADEGHPIPVVLNLSSWTSNRKALDKWLLDELTGKYHTPLEVARRWIQTDALLLLLDGLDEVSADQREACAQTINVYRQEHGFADLVVCSRSVDYDTLTHKLKLNGAITLQPLSDAQIDAYLSRLGPELQALRATLAEDDALREMSRTPLMLSILALAFQGATPSQLADLEVPDARRKHLFDLYVRRTIERRGRPSGYPTERMVHYLAWLARQMVRRVQIVFYIESLQPIWLANSMQQRGYRLVYRLSYVAVFVVASALLMASGLHPGLTLILAVLLAGGLLFKLFWGLALSGEEIVVYEALRWRWDRRKLVPGVLVGLTLVFVGAPAFGLVVGLAMMLVVGLEPETRQNVEMRTEPNQGIQRSLRVALLVALAWGLAGAAAWGVSWGQSTVDDQGWLTAIQAAVLNGIAWAAIGGFLFGGGDGITKHLILRPLLWLGGHAPMNFARFLDYATSLIFLRKVGGGYIFIHRYLLEHFAAMEKE